MAPLRCNDGVVNPRVPNRRPQTQLSLPRAVPGIAR